MICTQCKGLCDRIVEGVCFGCADEHYQGEMSVLRTEAVALKKDDGKLPVSLVAPDFIFGMARVLAFGVKKYKAWNWVQGKAWSRDLEAAQRHLLLWAGGEDLDPESGESHLFHCACDVMFLCVSQLRGLGTDDRMKFTKET